MRIAIVVDVYWPRINGLVVSVDVFSKALRGAGHTVGIFTNRYHDNTPRLDREAGRRDVFRFTSMPSPIYSRDDHVVAPHAWQDVYRALKHFRPDIVHVQTEFVIGQVGKFFAWRERVPLVMSSHTHYEFYAANYLPLLPAGIARAFTRSAMWRSFRDAEELVVPSELFREVMLRYGMRSRRLHVIPTGIDLASFWAEPAEIAAYGPTFRKRHGIPAEYRILLYVGRIGQEKNIGLLVDVLERVVRHDKNVMLVYVGDGPYRHTYHHLLHRRGLEAHVRFTGFIPHEELRLIYPQAEVFLFPSVSETQGLVTVEAMACGVPVVAVGEMGTYWVMRGDNGGFMVPNDPNAFADRVVALLSNPALRAEKASEAREYARSWSIDHMIERLLAVYHRVLSRRGCDAHRHGEANQAI